MAGNGVRKLIVEIAGDAKGAVAAMRDTEGAAGGLSGHMGALGAAVAGAVSVGAIVAFGASAVGEFQKVAGESRKLQRIIGGTAEDASRLRTAFQLTGVDGAGAEAAMKKLAKATQGVTDEDRKAEEQLQRKTDALEKQAAELEAVAHPTEAQTKKLAELRVEISKNTEELAGSGGAFNKYGVAVTDSNGKTRDMHAILMDTADKFKSMPDGAEKSAMAMKLFGKSGTDLIPFLNKGAEGIAALEKQSDKLGLTLTSKNLDALAKSKVAHREMDAAVSGLKVQIGAELMPVIAKITQWFATHLVEGIGYARQGVHALEGAFTTVAGIIENDVMPAVSAVINFLGEHREILIGVAVAISVGLVAAFLSWAVAAGAAAVATIAAALPVIAIGVAIAALVAGVIYAYEHWGFFRTAVDTVARVMTETVWPALKKVASFITDDVVPVVVTIATKFGEFGEKVASVVGDVVEFVGRIASKVGSVAGEVAGFIGTIVGKFEDLAGRVADIVRGIVEKLETIIGWVRDAPGKIASAASSMFDGVKQAFEGAIGFIKSVWNSIAEHTALHVHKSMPWPIPDINFDTPQLIPSLAEGGIVSARPGGRLVRVAEAGQDEAVIPLTKLAGMFGGGGPAVVIHNATFATRGDIDYAAAAIGRAVARQRSARRFAVDARGSR